MEVSASFRRGQRDVPIIEIAPLRMPTESPTPEPAPPPEPAPSPPDPAPPPREPAPPPEPAPASNAAALGAVPTADDFAPESIALSAARGARVRWTRVAIAVVVVVALAAVAWVWYDRRFANKQDGAATREPAANDASRNDDGARPTEETAEPGEPSLYVDWTPEDSGDSLQVVNTATMKVSSCPAALFAAGPVRLVFPDGKYVASVKAKKRVTGSCASDEHRHLVCPADGQQLTCNFSAPAPPRRAAYARRVFATDCAAAT